ncbi:nuclear transport factor 2 family protein [Saccharomonospora sp. CUA-673]|uniref:nuclear transport factor 2 family protein n=1 Tax=Saccharomonospora sp. CUA-673 TaxID=1904969 RepID=UPI001C9E3894|nr:nuclear transport factor 2 family protein [Saccharomonospora sp. CUA-673]
MDYVAEYRAASESGDIDRVVDALAPDAELVSPLSARMVFRGRDDLRVLLGAIYGLLGDLRWDQEFGDERTRVVVGSTKLGPLPLDDVMVLELADDGRIARIRPHLRPWLTTTRSPRRSRRRSSATPASSAAPSASDHPALTTSPNHQHRDADCQHGDANC